MSNDRFPNGWSNDEDEDYSNPFGSDNDDEEDESSPWAVKKAEQKSDETSTDNPAPTVKNNTGSTENTTNNPVKFTDNISNTPPQQSGQPINNYQHQSHKSDVNKVLITVIALLAVALVGGGAFVLINFRKDKDDKPDSDSVSIGEISATSETESTAAESTADVTTKITIENAAVETITKAVTEIPTEAVKSLKELKSTPIDEIKNYSQYTDIISGNVTGDSVFLCDINDDKIPELFVKNGEVTTAVYSIYKNKAVALLDGSGSLARGIQLYEGGTISLSYSSGTNSGTMYYKYAGNGVPEMIESIDNTAGENSHTIGDKTIKISVDEAINIQSKYIPVTFSSTLISMLVTEPATEKPTEPPTQKPTEKQSETMSYYTSASYGIINTKNDPLNMRSAPDTNAEIIYKVPIGAGVELLGESGSWYYARFILRDVAGDYSYEGYLSKEFVRTTSAQIISLVPKNGQINCHGVEVAGFTTNYIALGEPVSLIRKSLGDSWHITAKNMCVNHGVTWYELWDSDDGDYYGWVDSNYVDLDLYMLMQNFLQHIQTVLTLTI